MQQKMTILLFLVGLALTVVAFFQGGWAEVLAGLSGTLHLLLSVVLLIPIAFILAGLIHVLISKELVSRWLGVESGWRGILIGGLAGALIPGGPYVSFPIIAAIFKAGAGLPAIVCS